MLTETLKSYDDVVGIACKGKLSQNDIKRMHALLHEKLEERAQPDLVIDLTEFEGYNGFKALRDDLRMDFAHRNDFGRIAVIGRRRWMQWGTSLASLFTTSPVRWFDTSEAEAAAAWARGR